MRQQVARRRHVHHRDPVLGGQRQRPVARALVEDAVAQHRHVPEGRVPGDGVDGDPVLQVLAHPLAEAGQPDLAGLLQPFDRRSVALVDRVVVVRLEAVDEHDVDVIGPQPPEAGVDRLLECPRIADRFAFLRIAVGARPSRVGPLGREEIAVPRHAGQRGAKEQLRVAVALRGVDQVDAAIQAAVQEARLVRVGELRLREGGGATGAEGEQAHLDTAAPQGPIVHGGAGDPIRASSGRAPHAADPR